MTTLEDLLASLPPIELQDSPPSELPAGSEEDPWQVPVGDLVPFIVHPDTKARIEAAAQRGHMSMPVVLRWTRDLSRAR